ncbi:MAG: GNAT family N-acetyltransferase [Chloroflexi bacterium]|nr:GNAT family N-acetyltransferase [Chloroflexota bacterium]MCI0649266.1 GNAT family N-acetyltransferase [Chloroflexota bacterium]MCI0728850.1 GNAT family N-acetyltransferase [Chloroflexota bacterium]
MEDHSAVVAARTRELDEATRAAVIQVCIAAHDEPDFQRLFSFLPPDGLHVLGYSQSQLASHAVVTTRWLQPAGQPLLKTAYVDAVATDPAFQGRGFGSLVMRHLAWLVRDEYDIACLETERVTFYERLGWQEWRGPLAGRAERGLVPTPEQTGIMILRLPRTPELDWESLLTIECQPERIW